MLREINTQRRERGTEDEPSCALPPQGELFDGLNCKPGALVSRKQLSDDLSTLLSCAAAALQFGPAAFTRTQRRPNSPLTLLPPHLLQDGAVPER